ncbi:MAG TPA: flagellar export chaperone FliS [Gammaproteobacteria bacterium]|nr:flagellar export chaperone FliS [Gammaproteobacteria bacterium]
MSKSRATSMLSKYSQTAIDSGVESATPHRLVQMMMEGVLDKVALAKGFMARREYEAEGRHIKWAVSLINGLRMSLNKDDGGELAEDLDALYDYMVRQLLEAQVNSKSELLDEVTSLMREVKSGWDAIPDVLDSEAGAVQPGKYADAAPLGL